MIIIYHKNNKVEEVLFDDKPITFSEKSISNNLFDIAERYPDMLIIWCHLDFKANLNYSKIPDIFHHTKIMASYSVSTNHLLPKAIGYIDESSFVNINNKVSYATWQMSSDVGGLNTSVLKTLKNDIIKDSNFDYFLFSFAKLVMPLGLLCYSEPNLLLKNSQIYKKETTNNFLLFRFIKQHYKTRWIFLLLLNFFLYEKKVLLAPFLFSLFFRKRNLKDNLLDKIEIHSTKKVAKKKSIDVIIPTIGRKQYLYDVLKDLSCQNYLPKNVVIVEQNPDLTANSELDYLYTESWPFQIKHTFTHVCGACNARNIALEQIESEWIFMADDDIRIDADFLKSAFFLIEKSGVEQATFGCFEPNYPQIKKNKRQLQWSNFGSGCSIVKSENVKGIFFNKSFEFGYGEDSDFGMQLRNLGFDIHYLPNPEILHLKAPIGGFRTKPHLLWHNDLIQPKPAPTVMLYKILNLTTEQVKGYKTVLFFKYYKYQSIKNPFKYLSNFKKQWNVSLYWANQLNKN